MAYLNKGNWLSWTKEHVAFHLSSTALDADHWVFTTGAVIERVIVTHDSQVRVTLRKWGGKGKRVFAKPYPAGGFVMSQNGTKFAEAGVEHFSQTASVMEAFGDRIVWTVPVERTPYVPRNTSTKHKPHNRTSRPFDPQVVDNSLVGQELVAKLERLQPPAPTEAPAIPLKAAVDAINGHKLIEGQHMQLTIAPNGLLKVLCEYGG